MYCHIITHTGWTWEHIANKVTLPQALALFEHWGVHPPLQMMVAGYLGITGKKTGTLEDAKEFMPVSTATEDEFNALFEQMPYLLQ